eukprot:TRINITY_DN11289_c0_g1_i1.p1 TRINITY_DN11289_c0_g1~~TRINITY_DN11289_c0_g1_i1.p1  ORF type:complete len:597 (+),score=187.49 TRINITY_DN11289_c0_g1_i1:158-1792(+)
MPVGAIKGRLRAYKGDIKELYTKWIEATAGVPELIAEMKVEGDKRPAILININPTYLAKSVLSVIFEKDSAYGTSEVLKGQKICVEYSSPNIAKPFHAGHLRSTIIGNVLKNVHTALGGETVGINYLGDWGKQYGLLAVAFGKWGDEEKFAENAFDHLFDLYVRINQLKETDPTVDDEAREMFKRMEDGDEDCLAIWKRFVDASLKEYSQTYARLNVSFDYFDAESKQQEGMVNAYKILEEKGLLEDSEGAKIVNLKKYKLPNVVIRSKLGATLYLTRDLAAAKNRYDKFNFDKSIYVVASPQTTHFKQLFKILDLMGYEWSKKCVHVPFGMVKLPRDDSGKEVKMSSRKGNVVLLEGTLNKAQEVVHTKMLEDTKGKLSLIEDPKQQSDIIGLSAVVVQDLSARRIKDYEFVVERVTAKIGHTGPFLQYNHSRLCSMFDKNSDVTLTSDVDYSLITEPEAQALIVHLAKWPEVIEQTASALEPCLIVTYLFETSAAISSAHHALFVKGQPQNVQEARLLLFHAARVVLANGIRMLGLVPVERM